MTFDSRPDTHDHITKVQANLRDCILSLLYRAEGHDASKLRDPELAMFNEYTPKLAETEYGTPEYKALLEGMGSALQHHYENNSHHPEHNENGVSGMTLLDVLEMLCDWEAATKRMKDGDIRKSLDHNFQRFGISDQLASILRNTVEELWPT